VEKSKTAKFLILIMMLSIGFLCLYGGLHHPWISYVECRNNPGKYDGRIVVGFNEPTIGKIGPDGFELLQRGEKPVFVKTDTAGLRSDEYVALKAVFHKEGYLTARTIRIASHRREKMVVSLIPVVMIVFLFCRHFRFNTQKSKIELKPHA
jgi:hypothetical protein